MEYEDRLTITTPEGVELELQLAGLGSRFIAQVLDLLIKGAAMLRVVKVGGEPVDFMSSAIRNVLRLVDGIPTSYIPGMISILATKRNQRLGDLAAGTIV